jgi:hypothetical protein
MATFLYYTAALILFAHGLIHLIGVAVYWQLAVVNEIPYKTTLLGGRWEIGDSGMRVFGLLWFLGTIGFVVAAAGMVFRTTWWQPVLLVTTLFSLVITILDWDAAKFGAITNIIILIIIFVTGFMF